MFAVTMLVNGTMVVYHRVMSSSLGDAYAQLAALGGVANVLAVVTWGVAATLTKRLGTDFALGGEAAVGARLKAVVPAGLGIAVVLSVLLLLPASAVTAYLHLPRRLLYAMGVSLFGMGLVMYCARAALQGLHHFAWMGVSQIAEGLGRLSFAVLLVGAGYGVAGGLAATLLAQGLGLCLCLPVLFGLWRKAGALPVRADGDPIGLQTIVDDTLVLALFSTLCYVDVLILKHHYDEPRAAAYSRIALMGKSFLYLVIALSSVLFPTVVKARAEGRDPRPILWRFSAVAAVILALGWAALALWTPLAIRTLLGSDPAFLALAPLARGYAAAMIPVALFQMLLYYHLALRPRWLAGTLGVAVLVYVVGLNIFWASESSVIMCLAAVGLGLWSVCAAKALADKPAAAPVYPQEA